MLIEKGADSIITEDTGILTERSSESLGKSVRNLLKDKKRIRRMAINGRRVESFYSSDKLGEKFENYLKDIIATYKGR